MNDPKNSIEITPEMKAAHQKIHDAIGAPELTIAGYAKGAFAALAGSSDPLGISSALVDDLRAQVAALQDTLDLNNDEFARIAAIDSADSEIRQLCDRARRRTKQTVPVIAQLERAENEKCALAADALNAREALRMVVACIQQPQRCSPDFPKYAVKRANEVLEAEIMSVEAISIRRLEAVITECALALRPFATWDDGGEKDADFAAAERALESCASVLAPVSERAAGVDLKPCEHDGARSTTDPKLSDRGARHGTCVVCGKVAVEAGAVTCGTVRCSAWLAVIVELKKRVEEWKKTVVVRLSDAEHESDFGKRFIEHGAMCYLTATREVETALAPVCDYMPEFLATEPEAASPTEPPCL